MQTGWSEGNQWGTAKRRSVRSSVFLPLVMLKPERLGDLLQGFGNRRVSASPKLQFVAPTNPWIHESTAPWEQAWSTRFPTLATDTTLRITDICILMPGARLDRLDRLDPGDPPVTTAFGDDDSQGFRVVVTCCDMLWHLYVWKGLVASEWHPHYHDTMIYIDILWFTVLVSYTPTQKPRRHTRRIYIQYVASIADLTQGQFRRGRVDVVHNVHIQVIKMRSLKDPSPWFPWFPWSSRLLGLPLLSIEMFDFCRVLARLEQNGDDSKEQCAVVLWLCAVFDTLWHSVDGKVWESHAKMISECYDSSLFLGCSQHRRSVWGVNLKNQDYAFNVPRTCWRHPALSHFLDLLTHSSCVAL